MIKQPKNILFASDLSVDMNQVFEHAVGMAAYTKADIIVLHVMEEIGTKAEKQLRMAFGKTLYQNVKNEQRTGVRHLLIGKNLEAIRIRQAIATFFNAQEGDAPDLASPIKKILVSESKSVANEIISTALDEECGVIVMGCRQQGLLAEAIGNKLVRKVLQRTSVPVYMVPFAGK
jgi:nucleotide-binding universal stress UspA family protein